MKYKYENHIIITHLVSIIGIFILSTNAITIYELLNPLLHSLLYDICMGTSIITFFLSLNRTKETKFFKQLWWYVCFTVNSFGIQLSVFEVLDCNFGIILEYSVSIISVLIFPILFIAISKRLFKNILHTINIIIVSTFIIIFLSYLFSVYYATTYNVSISSANVNDYGIFNLIYQYMSYGKFSLRYFFEFPREEYYDWITFIQFMIGKIYEAVIIGGIANIITKHIGKSSCDSESTQQEPER